jgi:hypothetical protein
MVCAHDGRRGSVILYLFLATLITLNEGFKMPAKGMRFPGSQRKAAITIPEKDPKFDFGPLGKLAFSLLPLSPESVGRRKTIFTEVVAGKVWTLDQVANNYQPPLDDLKQDFKFFLVLSDVHHLLPSYRCKESSMSMYL